MNEKHAIHRYVAGKLMKLVHSSHDAAVTAALARLRRGIGKEPGGQPEIWEITLEGMPEALQGRGNQPSYAERAAHTALTLFALHQQGKRMREKCMYEQEQSLGRAVRIFIYREPDREQAITRRFLATVTADSYTELTWHLRGLIQLLRTKNISLDYPALAEDLFRFQFPGQQDQIRLQWGRQFHRSYHTDQEESSTQGDPRTEDVTNG